MFEHEKARQPRQRLASHKKISDTLNNQIYKEAGPKKQAGICAKSRLNAAQLAAKLDDIIARAEQQTKYALADHRLMCGMARHEPVPRPRRVSINVRGGTLVARVLSPEAEVKLVAYMRRLACEVSDLPFEDYADGETCR